MDRPHDPARRPSGGATTRTRPNPNPMRLMLGMAGIATVSALTAAMAPSIVPQAASAPGGAAAPGGAVTAAAALPGETLPAAAAPVRKVTRYVVLEPGQTPPPGAATKAQPQPTPIVKTKVVTRTRQSGQP